MDTIKQGVSGRIEVTKNCGNYNQVKLALEGSKEEIAVQMPSFVALLKGLSMAVSEAVGTTTQEEAVRPTTGVPEPPTAPKEDTSARRDGVELYTEKRPPDRPEPALDDNGETIMYHNEKKNTYAPIHICPNCGARHTLYEKEYKGKNQWAFSCNRKFSEVNCGYWTVWDKE